MTNWKWLTHEAIEIIHHEQLREHGGLPGTKDDNAIEAALARPQNKVAYDNPTVFDLAAAYLFGIARNHPFLDGNKRTAYLAAYTFLRIHKLEVNANDGQIIGLVMGVAAGEIDEANIAAFFSDHTDSLW